MQNGHDDDENIAPFPGKRERAQKERLKKIATHEAARKKSEPFLNIPPATKALCGIVTAAFLMQQGGAWLFGDDAVYAWTYELAFVPARYTGGMPFTPGAIAAPVTHMFLHGGWLHFGMNILTLLAFGGGLEKTAGARRLLIWFFATGLAGALAHFVFSMDEPWPMIGASGAISGLFGALLVLLHDHGVMGREIRLLPLAVVWIGISVIFGLTGVEGMQVAWITHVGGFLSGLALARPVARMRI